MANSAIPTTKYPMSVWEVVAVIGSAILILAAGGLRLGIKFANNASNPKRAEIVAKSIMDYKIPGGSQGRYSINIGGVKTAVVTSKHPQLDIKLFVARIPVDQENEEEQIISLEPASEITSRGIEEKRRKNHNDNSKGIDIKENFNNILLWEKRLLWDRKQEFNVKSSRTEKKKFCDKLVEVTVREGELILENQPLPVLAVEYNASVAIQSRKHFAIVQASGKNAKRNAITVFDSLRCK